MAQDPHSGHEIAARYLLPTEGDTAKPHSKALLQLVNEPEVPFLYPISAPSTLTKKELVNLALVHKRDENEEESGIPTPCTSPLQDVSLELYEEIVLPDNLFLPSLSHTKNRRIDRKESLVQEHAQVPKPSTLPFSL